MWFPQLWLQLSLRHQRGRTSRCPAFLDLAATKQAPFERHLLGSKLATLGDFADLMWLLLTQFSHHSKVSASTTGGEFPKQGTERAHRGSRCLWSAHGSWWAFCWLPRHRWLILSILQYPMSAKLRYSGSSPVAPKQVRPIVFYVAGCPLTFCRTSLGIAETATNSGGWKSSSR